MASRLLRAGSLFGSRFKHEMRRQNKPIVPIPVWNIVKKDRVQIIEGKDKGKQGYVKEVLREKNAVVVKGLKLHPRMYRMYVHLICLCLGEKRL